MIVKTIIPYKNIKGHVNYKQRIPMNELEKRIVLLLINAEELKIIDYSLGESLEKIYGIKKRFEPWITNTMNKLSESGVLQLEINSEICDESIGKIASFIEPQIEKQLKKDNFIKLNMKKKSLPFNYFVSIIPGLKIIKDAIIIRPYDGVELQTYDKETLEDISESRVKINDNEQVIKTNIVINSNCWIEHKIDINISDNEIIVNNKTSEIILNFMNRNSEYLNQLKKDIQALININGLEKIKMINNWKRVQKISNLKILSKTTMPNLEFKIFCDNKTVNYIAAKDFSTKINDKFILLTHPVYFPMFLNFFNDYKNIINSNIKYIDNFFPEKIQALIYQTIIKNIEHFTNSEMWIIFIKKGINNIDDLMKINLEKWPQIYGQNGWGEILDLSKKNKSKNDFNFKLIDILMNHFKIGYLEFYNELKIDYDDNTTIFPDWSEEIAVKKFLIWINENPIFKIKHKKLDKVIKLWKINVQKMAKNNIYSSKIKKYIQEYKKILSTLHNKNKKK